MSPIAAPDRPRSRTDLAGLEELGPAGERIALVSDQASTIGGQERVVDALLARWPAARLLSLRFDCTYGPWPTGERATTLAGHTARKLHYLAPLYARRVAALPVGDARIVLSLSQGLWALSAPAPPGASHVALVPGPCRAFHGHVRRYLRDYPPALRPLLLAALPALRRWERAQVRRPDRVLAASSEAARWIRSAYRVEADVVHPPVRTGVLRPAASRGQDFLAVARLTPAKRIDVLVEAFRGLDQRLVVAGAGTQLEALRARAPANVRLEGFVSERRLIELYRSSRALICPSVEEFGIAMAEAQGCGLPVIAPRSGGAREIVRDGVTGILLDRADARSIAAAVRAVASRDFDPDACRARAERFSEAAFVVAIERVLAEELARAGNGHAATPAAASASSRS